jgi:hypothetical protein
MANLKDILIYILKNYPHKDHLSNARVTKIVYLADWYKAIKYQKQITNIEWYFDNYGPFVWDICNEVNSDPNTFILKKKFNVYKNESKIFALKNKHLEVQLPNEDQNSIDYVIKATEGLGWDDFIQLVYSTYPVISSDRYSRLNLVEKAKSYNLSNK